MTRLTTEQLESIRKNAEKASGLLFTTQTTIQAVEKDIPALLAEVDKLNVEISDRETSHIDLYNENKRLEDEVKRLQAQLNGGDA